jgi:hypothetical protein
MGFLNTDGAQYIPVGFAIMLAVFFVGAASSNVLCSKCVEKAPDEQAQ